ncbi:hypothetical protein EVAR_14797_1 [Eumeta japonica]|uniref:Histone-lysine N-methyltransferase SETMAR n=1 Tax=Eumeta variegata TaxID=151549 RepID=A0A4C1TWZ8_EUMVA|nr:hypothetical protein EVAR_14797_1 [Eumeta japonica]
MTISNSFAKFKRGHVNLTDGFRDSRPSTAVNNKNRDAVRRGIDTDRYVNYHEIRASLGIDKQTNKFLKEKKVELMSNPAYSPDLRPYDSF